jgi:hypothetical protein
MDAVKKTQIPRVRNRGSQHPKCNVCKYIYKARK